MTEPIIMTRDLTKFYGKSLGVEGLNLEVQVGEVFGFLGPNGAGKTTTIRLLLDFLRPTRGRAKILGWDSRRGSLEIHRRVGYLPGELALYEHMTGRELLAYFANLRGHVDWTYVLGLADRFDFDLDRRIGQLSRGNKQKLGIVQAFMHEPELLILDEPTMGLDPLMQQEFYRLIGEVQVRGHTVFLSSHILPEVERICQRVGVIRSGRLVAVESVEVLKKRALRLLEIHFARPVPPEPFASLPGVVETWRENNVIRVKIKGPVDPVIKAAAQFPVVDVVSHEASLEEIFLHYYGDGYGDGHGDGHGGGPLAGPSPHDEQGGRFHAA